MRIDFASRAPRLELADPLAEAFGVLAPGERFRYTYEDAVKLSGYSCPSVAGAYLMTAVALRILYQSETPVRGEIEVTVGGDPEDGYAGPTAQVISLLTGAAPETGFVGVAGRWRRAGLLKFDQRLDGKVRFRRRDTGATVEVTYDPGNVAPSPEIRRLLTPSLSGEATQEEKHQFGKAWQARVEDILTGDPLRVVHVYQLGSTGSHAQ